MIRYVLHGSLQYSKSNVVRFVLYSTKQLPKNALAAKSTTKFVASEKYSAEKLEAVKLDDISVANKIQNLKIENAAKNVKVGSVVTAIENARKEGKLPIINWEVTPSNDLSKLLDQYMMLSKVRLTTLVVITTMVGYAMAPAPFDLSTFLFCTVGTGLCSAASNSVNQYHEVPYDAQMARTKNRVLVRGQLTSTHAINYAITSAALGTGLLFFGVNGYAAALGAANLFLYTSVYTPMKRVSILNTWIGSVVGAIPPIIGWVGCSGTFDAGSLLLAAILYSWQFPHFNALSWNLRPDYSRAGYRMMAVSHPALCRRTALRHTCALTIFTALAPVFDLTNIWFTVETLPLNLYFGYLAYQFHQNSDSGSSRKLFRFSLIHLPILMILFFINKKEWKSEKDSLRSSSTTPVQTADSTLVASTAKAVM